MPVAFCEEDDVKHVLQERSLEGQVGTDYVTPAIHAASDWFARQTNGYWYDSAGSPTLIDTSAATASDIQVDVPSSPHAQDRRLISDRRNANYPVTVAGSYAEIPLPHIYVDSITKLEVRQVNGEVEDWVADSSKTSGRGNDYYLQTRGQNSYGRTYLYIDARAIGSRTNFDRLLTLEYTYGLDKATEDWWDVRRGIAQLAAVEVIAEDSVITQFPEQGTLIGAETQHGQLLESAENYLGDYLSDIGDNR